MATPPPGVNTAVKQTTGGFNSATIYSGSAAPGLTCAPGAVAVGTDVLFSSGAGRLDTVLVHQHVAVFVSSALPVVFYDAHIPVANGPSYASGHRLLTFTPGFVVGSGTINASASGNAVNFPVTWGTPVQLGIPFVSGLCANCKSGVPGFTVTWTTEVNPQ